MRSSLRADICVIGGGPAGSTVAHQLALLGYSVCLIERFAFPRPHIGESLPPGILPLLETLGVRESVEQAGFLRPRHAIVRWAEAANSVKELGGDPGFQVDRGRFDQILLDAAREANVRILQPAVALQPTHQGVQRWEVPVRDHTGDRTVEAAFLIDASGRRCFLKGAKHLHAARTIAVFGYWRNGNLRGRETRIEAGSQCWYWGAPLPDGSFNATVFLDAMRHTASGRKGLEAEYRQFLAESLLLNGCLQGTLASGIQACDASCYQRKEVGALDWLCVGEAAFAIDPLSSQGVQTAIGSAIQAAITVHTILTAPENAEIALEFYRTRQQESVERHQKRAAMHYAEPQLWSDQPFWKRRAELVNAVAPAAQYPHYPMPEMDTVFALSPNVSFQMTPCIVDHQIVLRHALYHPNLSRPVAFIEGIPLAPLVGMIAPGTAASLLQNLSVRIPGGSGLKIVRWMIGNGILVPIA